MINYFLVFILIFLSLDAKLLIMTHCFNKPNFIYWQNGCFKKFLKDDYEFIVFNDTPNTSLFLQTEKICQHLNIRCIPIPQDIHAGRDEPSVACADTIQYMIQNYGLNYPGIVVLIDSDMFMIRELSIESFLKDYDVAANLQTRIGETMPILYWLPNLIFFDMQKLPDQEQLDFQLGEIDGVRVDTGGFNHFYIQNHPEVSWKHTTLYYSYDEACCIEHSVIDNFKKYPKLWSLMNENLYDYEFYNDFSFFHFKAGSNWNKMNPKKYQEKMKLIKKAMKELLNDI